MQQLIYSEKIDNVSTSTISVQNIFTSNHDFYEVLLYNCSTSSGETDITLQLRDNSNTLITTNYYYAISRQRSVAVSTRMNSQNGANMYLVQTASRPKIGTANIKIANPLRNAETTIGLISTSGNSTEYRGYVGTGAQVDNNIVTGFDINFSTAVIYANVKVYGYDKV